MKTKIDFPYAYHDLKESFRELIPHLKRNALAIPEPLNGDIDPQLTPKQLQACEAIFSSYVKSMKESTVLEQKVTGILLESFLMDAEIFVSKLLDEGTKLAGATSSDHGEMSDV